MSMNDYLTVLEAAVRELRERVQPLNPERFQMMAGPYLAEINRVHTLIELGMPWNS